MPVESDESQAAIHPDPQARAETGAPGRVALQAVLALLGLCGIGIVLLSTSRYGVGTFSDAEHHLGAARSLLAGKGYQYCHGGPYTGWPPLFPTLLAAIGLTGLDPQVGARLLNSVAFGLIIFFSGQLFARCTSSKGLVLAGTLSVLAAGPVLGWCVMAATEPVFIVLVTLFVLCMPRFLRRQNWPSLVLVASLAGLACLQRYAGVSVILAGLILVGWSGSRASLLQRLKQVVVFGTISGAPIVLWCLRNRLLAGETVGIHRFHLVSHRQFLGASRSAAQAVSAWLLPWAKAGPVQSAGLSLIIILLLAGILILLSGMIRAGPRRFLRSPASDRDRQEACALQIWSALVTGLTYFCFLAACGAGLDWLPEQRHMVPIYAPVVVLCVAGIEGARRLLSGSWGRRRWVDFVVLALCALWLQYPLRVLHHDTAYRMKDGAGGFSTAAWVNSPLLAWLRNHPLPSRVYTNAPDAIYLLTGAVTWLTPQVQYEHAPAEFARDSVPQACHIVWFHHLQRTRLYDLREVLSWCRVREIAAFPDGSVYQYLGAGGPGVSAVYRFWSARLGRHLYTMPKAERNRLFNENDGTWAYEGPAFYAFAPNDVRPPDVCPVYRFRSARLKTDFYTLDEAEKDRLLLPSLGAWTCEGVAFYAWPGPGAKDALPVYRFWSPRLGSHFYTLSESEKARLVRASPDVWTYEGIAWYAQGPLLPPASGEEQGPPETEPIEETASGLGGRA